MKLSVLHTVACHGNAGIVLEIRNQIPGDNTRAVWSGTSGNERNGVNGVSRRRTEQRENGEELVSSFEVHVCRTKSERMISELKRSETEWNAVKRNVVKLNVV